MNVQLYEDAKKIWRIMSETGEPPELTLSMEVHKKVLKFFQVGDFYYFIFNVAQGSLDYMHETVTRIMGYKPEEMSVARLIDMIHPEDRPWFFDFENSVVDFFYNLPLEERFSYKVRYDIRFRKANGDYIRLLQQSIPLQYDENGTLLRSLVVHTDISFLKTSGLPVLTLVSLDNEQREFQIPIKKILTGGPLFTRREKEILRLMLEGMNRYQVGGALCISKQTVDQHCKNMLKKSGQPSTTTLLIKVVQEGWL